jgi:hypothetical protein
MKILPILAASVALVSCSSPLPTPLSASPPAMPSPADGRAHEGTPAVSLPSPTGDIHDFDFLAGDWKLDNRRLRKRGVGSNDWEEFPATDHATIFLGGAANVDEIVFPTKGWSGLTVRTFDRAKRQWSIYWINSRNGVLVAPEVGGFTGDRGEFYGDDEDDGRQVKVRYIWIKRGPDAAHWEQAFSYDEGRTWETNWVNDLRRPNAP